MVELTESLIDFEYREKKRKMRYLYGIIELQFNCNRVNYF